MLCVLKHQNPDFPWRKDRVFYHTPFQAKITDLSVVRVTPAPRFPTAGPTGMRGAPRGHDPAHPPEGRLELVSRLQWDVSPTFQN